MSKPREKPAWSRQQLHRNIQCYIPEDRTLHVGLEVPTAVVLKSTIVWDITPWSPLRVNRRFRGTYRLHLQSRKNKLSKKPAWEQVASRAQLIVRLWRWRRYVPLKRRLTLNGLHGVISKKMVLCRTLHNVRCENLKSFTVPCAWTLGAS
jgi:hypothetical protein